MKTDIMVALIVDLVISTGNYVGKVVRTNKGASLKFGKEMVLVLMPMTHTPMSLSGVGIVMDIRQLSVLWIMRNKKLSMTEFLSRKEAYFEPHITF